METIAPDESWESRWEPLPVGERFFLVPDWRDDAAPPGRLRLVSHAGPAPGSGYHAPTQLALRAMERVARAADDFLDVGTGAGILAQAAHLLGCRRRVACDIDADSVAVARLVRTPADLFVGSPRSLGSRSFDLVAANLNAVALLNLRRELTRVLRPQGRLILSGFRQPRSAELVGAFGLPVRHRLDCEPWCCVVLVKGADHENRASS
jgi:ribosomal protein L11 methyltransferase